VKLAAGETRHFAVVDTDAAHQAGERVILLSDYRASRIAPQEEWIAGGPFNMNLCLE
jgi:hypothetical protein